MSEHLGERAELYALGLLEDTERAAVEAHLAGCAACRRLVGAAEAAAAALAATVPYVEPSVSLGNRIEASARAATAPTFVMNLPLPREIPARTFRPAWLQTAVAAALVVALGGTLAQNAQLRDQAAEDRVAMTQVVHSHFNHVTMVTSPSAGALAAKVLYARDGSWIYVLVDHPMPGLRVAATVDGAERQLGSPVRHGDIATLFVSDAGRPTAVVLRVGETVEANAPLRY